MSIFSQCELAPPDPILGTALAYKADPDPRKVNLGIGAYRTEEGKPFVLPIVRKVEQELSSDPTIDKEYSTIDGPIPLKGPCQEVLFGRSDDRIATCQALSGTGALRVCAEFAAKHLGKPKVYVSNPTWGNHLAIFKAAGLEVEQYPYWDAEKRDVNFQGMLECLKSAPEGSLVLLHACAHNPTGMDLTQEQWKELLGLMQSRPLTPLLDNAYQGYASGSLEEDAFAQRLIFESGMEFFLCQSFAKNFGLYGERIGMLHVVCQDKGTAEKVLSQLKLVVRPMYSSPPIHGAQLVWKILGSKENRAAWEKELKEISERIQKVRTDLAEGLKKKGTPGTWDHIQRQIGMFSFTGLSVPQSERMISSHHIYMLKNGRISLAGLNQGNIDYVIQAVDEVVRNA